MVLYSIYSDVALHTSWELNARDERGTQTDSNKMAPKTNPARTAPLRNRF